jgi:hypothetical protein
LSEVNLPPELTTIGAEAFMGCLNLGPTLSIPAKVMTIGAGAFSDVSAVKEAAFESRSRGAATLAVRNSSDCDRPRRTGV